MRFQATTTAITDEAGSSHGTIFVHFPNVESLLLCLLREFGDDIKAELHGFSASTDIHALLDIHLRVFIEHEAFYQRLVSEAAYLHKQAKHTLISIQSLLSFYFVRMLQPEIASGKVKDIPLHTLFNTWLALIHYYIHYSELFAPGKSVLTRHRLALIQSYLALISN